MQTHESVSTLHLLRWQAKNITIFTSLSILGGAASALSRRAGAVLPDVSVTAIGAVGICCSFHSNAAYDRWWEGRRLWGQLIISSRHLCSHALSYLRSHDERHVPAPLALEPDRKGVLM